MVGEVLKRQRASPPDLDRLQTVLADVADRLVSAAHGNLSLHRWYRRIAVSVRLCHQARVCLPGYARTGAMTVAEVSAIDAGLGCVIDRLNEALESVALSEDERVLLPKTFPRPNDLH